MKKAQKGFTLIELLVVIAIIGVLSTLAVVSLNNARAKSRDSKRVADVKQVQNALELYFNENSGYPGTAAAGITLGGASTAALSAGAGFSATSSVSGTVFMQQVPSAPTPNETGCTAAQNAYTYISTASSSYTIDYCLGAKTGSIPGGLNKACQSGVTGC